MFLYTKCILLLVLTSNHEPHPYTYVCTEARNVHLKIPRSKNKAFYRFGRNYERASTHHSHEIEATRGVGGRTCPHIRRRAIHARRRQPGIRDY